MSEHDHKKGPTVQSVTEESSRHIVRGRFAGFLLLAIPCLAACGQAEEARTRSRLNDTVVVSNRRSVHRDTAALELVRRYGAFDGSIEYEFNNIQDLAVRPNGDVYVFDMDVGIKHFDASGEFKRWVARIGAGPDEVGRATALTVGPRGEVAAYDLRNSRISVFQADSATRIMQRPSGMPRYGEDGLFFDDHGSLWVGINPVHGPDPVRFPRPVFARLNAEGSLVDTVFVPATAEVGCVPSEMRYRAGFWEDKRVQWFPMVKWAMGPDGSLAYGCPARYELDMIRSGEPPMRVRRSWTPALTDSDEEAFYRQFWQPMPPLPRERPAYARIILPGDGRIWVWPVQPSERRQLDDGARAMAGRKVGWMSGQHGAFDVFATSGDWIGSVSLPDGVVYSGYPDTEPVVIRGDTIWVKMRDELDVTYVGRFEVRWHDDSNAHSSR